MKDIFGDFFEIYNVTEKDKQELLSRVMAALKNQRHACAEALTECDSDVSGECIWFDEAHAAVMNAEI